jgi:hypothetical protein
VSSFLNIRVADIQAIYQTRSERGAHFLTPPIDRGPETRCYLRDPDGHLVELGQTNRTVSRPAASGSQDTISFARSTLGRVFTESSVQRTGAMR